MHNKALLITSLSLLLMGCQDGWPIDPPILQDPGQCGWNVTKENPNGAFFCVSTHPKKEDRITEIVQPLDPRMKGAQCASPVDFKKSESWLLSVKQWIRDNT